jgi:hypothetical protein
VSEPLYVLCVEVASAAPEGWVRWRAVQVEREDRFLTRDQVEALISRMSPNRRFVTIAKSERGELTQIGEHFQRADNMVMEQTFTPWDLGSLADADMRALFFDAMSSAEYSVLPSPEPDHLPVPVQAAVKLATDSSAEGSPGRRSCVLGQRRSRLARPLKPAATSDPPLRSAGRMTFGVTDLEQGVRRLVRDSANKARPPEQEPERERRLPDIVSTAR